MLLIFDISISIRDRSSKKLQRHPFPDIEEILLGLYSLTIVRDTLDSRALKHKSKFCLDRSFFRDIYSQSMFSAHRLICHRKISLIVYVQC